MRPQIRSVASSLQSEEPRSPSLSITSSSLNGGESEKLVIYMLVINPKSEQEESDVCSYVRIYSVTLHFYNV